MSVKLAYRPLDRWWTLPVLTLDECRRVTGLSRSELVRLIGRGRLERRRIEGSRRVLVTTASVVALVGLPPGAEPSGTPSRWAQQQADAWLRQLGGSRIAS